MSEALKFLANGIQYILNALQAILDALNPILYILRVLDMLVSILPAPADLSSFYDSYIVSMTWLAPTFALANHFINLPVFATAVFVMLLIESALNVFRLWRMVRSTVT